MLAGWQARMGGIGDIAKSVAAPITLYALFFVPTVNVHIIDLRVDKGIINYVTADGGYMKVEEVPYAIAAIPASASLLVSLFIDLVDTNWNSISLGNKFSTLGFQEVSHISKVAMIISQLKSIKNPSIGAIAYNLNQYTKHCLLEEGLKDPNNKQILTHPTKPFPEMFDPSIYNGNLTNTTVTFEDANGTVVNQTCQSLYATYVSGVSGDIETGMKELLQERFPDMNPDDANFNESYREQIGDNANIVGNIGKAMATLSASRALEKSLDTEGIGVNGVTMATELSIQSTITNLRTEGLAKFEWLARMLPNAIAIILGILIGAFPLMIIVMSFFGKNAIKGIANFFMGYIAINFNLVSLALVHNIISYYTAKKAQEAIVSYAGMPFGLTQVNDFMMQQADMAGLAGLIGAISVLGVTPLIFHGETKGLSAALNGVSGAFRGNVGKTAQDTLKNADVQAELDKQAHEELTSGGLTEAEASSWLSNEGYRRPNSMSAVEAMNGIVKDIGSAGASHAAQDILHSGNAQNFMNGSAAQQAQTLNRTAGFGSRVDMESAGSVAFEDGEVMGSMINKTAELRSGSDSYNTSDIGSGQAISRFGKDMGSATLANLDPDASATVANANNAVLGQVGAGQGLLNKTGVINDDGTLNEESSILRSVMTGSAMQSSGKLMNLKGMGDSINGDIESDGFYNHMKGSEFQGRNSANKNIADGEKWDSLGSDDNDPDKVSLMKKVKENEVASTFGGIEATNEELMKHGGVDGAIKDMVTGAQYGGIKSSANAQNLRTNFGPKLENEKVIVSQSDINEAKKEQQNLLSQHNNTMNDKSLSEDEKANKLTDTIDKLNAQEDLIDGGVKSTTLRDSIAAIDQSKIDSMSGQAIGIKSNLDADVEYAQNAMYGEMSNQQKTKAKLAAHGGVEGAVSVDVMEAGQKASQQKGAVEGLQSEAQNIGDKIGKSAAKVIEDTAKTMSSAKIATDAEAISHFNNPSEFVQSEVNKTSKQASADKARLDFYGNQANMQNFHDSIAAKSENPDEYYKNVSKLGAGDIKDGKFIANSGKEAQDALSRMGAMDMAGHSQLTVGGESFNVDVGNDGKTRVTKASKENTSGDDISLMDIASGVLQAGANIFTINEMSKGFDKDGISVGRKAKNKFDSFFSEKSSSKTSDGSNKSGKNHNPNNSSHGSIAEQIEANSKSKLDAPGRNSKGHSRMKAGGVAGTIAFVGDAIATGNYKEAISGVQEFGSRIMDGKLFGGNDGQGGASTMLENLIVGNDARQQAFKKIDSGSYASGFTTLAKGMAQQAVNGVGELGEMAIAGVKTTYNGHSYTQNRMANVIPDASFVSPVPQHAQNAFSTPSGFNTSSAMKNAYNDNTSNVNSTPLEYLKDNSQVSADKADDMNMGMDSMIDLSEQSAEMLEKIYSKNEE